VSQEQISKDLMSLLVSSCLNVWSGYVHPALLYEVVDSKSDFIVLLQVTLPLYSKSYNENSKFQDNSSSSPVDLMPLLFLW
jgi:hypothetical protein